VHRRTEGVIYLEGIIADFYLVRSVQ